jgi:hypothetical protein
LSLDSIFFLPAVCNFWLNARLLMPNNRGLYKWYLAYKEEHYLCHQGKYGSWHLSSPVLPCVICSKQLPSLKEFAPLWISDFSVALWIQFSDEFKKIYYFMLFIQLLLIHRWEDILFSFYIPRIEKVPLQSFF